jgi:hypothetical protein
MSVLRPTLISVSGPSLDYQATYFRVFEAVKSRRSLAHGQLHDDDGLSCAIGAYFDESNIPISMKAIDEIAAYNDSFPHLRPAQRWRKVAAWLRAKVKTL